MSAEALETARFGRDPLGYLRRRREREGDVFELRLSFAGPVTVVAGGPALQALLEGDPALARAGEARRRILPMASERSAFGADGDVHARQRQRLSPAFAPAAMAARRGAIEAIAARHVAAWPRGRPVQLLSRMRTLADDVYVRTVLGIVDERRARDAVAALGAMLRVPGNPPAPPPSAEGGAAGALGAAVFARRRRPLERVLAAEVEARRGRSTPAREAPDAIAALLEADPPARSGEALAELTTLSMAAQEPAAIALTWLLTRLARHPELAEDYLRAGAGSPLREAVLRESLRLRPPATAALRRLRRPLRAGGRELPAGTVAMVPIPLLHRDPDAFPRPDSFLPSRWLPPAEAPPRFLPFGAGRRRCLGEALAQTEIAAVVPEVLAAVRLRPLWPREERMALRGTVLVPHRSAPVLVAER